MLELYRMSRQKVWLKSSTFGWHHQGTASNSRMETQIPASEPWRISLGVWRPGNSCRLSVDRRVAVRWYYWTADNDQTQSNFRLLPYVLYDSLLKCYKDRQLRIWDVEWEQIWRWFHIGGIRRYIRQGWGWWRISADSTQPNATNSGQRWKRIAGLEVETPWTVTGAESEASDIKPPCGFRQLVWRCSTLHGFNEAQLWVDIKRPHLPKG